MHWYQVLYQKPFSKEHLVCMSCNKCVRAIMMSARMSCTCYVDIIIGHQHHTAIDASRGKGRTPVPAKISRGFPQEVVVRYHVRQLQEQLL